MAKDPKKRLRYSSPSSHHFLLMMSEPSSRILWKGSTAQGKIELETN